MRLCNDWGIPHSKFLEEWSDEDRAKAIAYRTHEASYCSMCGTAPWEWDPEQGGSRFAYEPYEEICPGCEKKEWVRESREGPAPAGSHIALRPPEE